MLVVVLLGHGGAEGVVEDARRGYCFFLEVELDACEIRKVWERLSLQLNLRGVTCF